MRTIQSRNNSRWNDRNDRDRDEFSNSGMEDSWRNEDYYYFENDEDRRGYNNRDYSSDNYWAGRDDIRGERYGQDSGYVPAMDYGRSRRRPGSARAVGYGNEGSGQMRDFERWRDGGEGYAGRNSNDYRNGYGSRDYYNPSGYDRDSSRRDDLPGHYGGYGRERRGYGREEESYGDYQSYPAYEARGYRPGEYDPDRSDRFRNGGYNEREYGCARRPHIREKRY